MLRQRATQPSGGGRALNRPRARLACCACCASQGCGVNSVYDLNRIEFRNPQPYSNMTDKYLCLSNIRLL